MSNVVKKHNNLVNASYSLTLSEQRLVAMAIANAQGKKELLEGVMTLNAQDYAEKYDMSLNAAYMALSDASAQLFERRFSWKYLSDKGVEQVSVRRWIYGIDYIKSEGRLKLRFSPDIVPYLAQLQSAYSYYSIEQVAGLTSAYAFRLYELLIAWRKSGEMPKISLADLRNRLGVLDGEYKVMKNFKARVLDVAVKQINEHTDIDVSYEQHKRGRVITDFTFKFKPKVTVSMLSSDVNDDGRDDNTFDMFDSFKMTDKQRRYFSDKLAKLPECAHLANPNEIKSAAEFSDWIYNDLLNPNSPNNWAYFLKIVGYNPNYKGK